MIKSYLNISLLALLLVATGGIADSKILPKGILMLDGREAPSLALNDLDGEPYELKQSQGRWVFLHFWASWCGPCRREMPTIQETATTNSDLAIDFVLINTAEDEDTIFTFMGIAAPDLRTLMDSDGLVTEQWQPRGLPATFFIDPAGKLRYLALGGRPWNKTKYLNFLKSL